MTAPSLVDLILLLAAMIGAGVFAGLIAGLFGVGGGTVIVPVLFYVFELLGVGGQPVRAIRQSGRSTFYCPRCQH